jgi:hypothetical protein
MGLLVDQEQLGPLGVVPDDRLGTRRAGPQHEPRPAEDRNCGAIGIGDRIGDEHVHRLRRHISDLRRHPLADRLQPPRRPPRPGLGCGRVVDAEVRRLQGPPVGGRTLGEGGQGGKGEEEEDGEKPHGC